MIMFATNETFVRVSASTVMVSFLHQFSAVVQNLHSYSAFWNTFTLYFLVGNANIGI